MPAKTKSKTDASTKTKTGKIEKKEKKEKKKRTPNPKLLVPFPERTCGRSTFKRMSYQDQSETLGLKFEYDKVIKNKDGTPRLLKKRPPSESVNSQRYLRTNYYETSSTNAAVSYPPKAALSRVMHDILKTCNIERERKLGVRETKAEDPSEEESVEEEEGTDFVIQEVALHHIKVELNNFLHSYLTATQVNVAGNGKVVLKAKHMIYDIVSKIIGGTTPAKFLDLKNCFTDLAGPDKIQIGGEVVEVKEYLYVGESLKELLIKSGIISKSAEIVTLINRMAYYWLYLCASDILQVLIHQKRKKVTTDHVRNFIKSIANGTITFG
jgi:hypothetical protein